MLGLCGGDVEVDETYVGRYKGVSKRGSRDEQAKCVVALVQRGGSV